ARKYHPDLNPGDKAAEEKFKAVSEANEILGDEKKRKMYDQVGFYSEGGMPGGGNPFGQGSPNMGFGGFDFSDFLNQQQGAAGGGRRRPPNAGGGGEGGGGGFRDIFSQFFGQQREQTNPTANAPEKGSDLEYTLNIDFWESIKGTQARMNISRHDACTTCHGSGQGSGGPVSCPECSGSGQVTQMAGAMRFTLSCPRCNGTGKLQSACPTCKGEGRLARMDFVDTRIPAGVSTGTRLRVAGKGNAGTGGAPAGDLYINIRVKDHPFFEREGDNIEITVPVSVPEAALGAKIEVPTIDGRALLKIPMGTQNGQKFRLREKGVWNARKETRGDQIVQIAVQPPKANDERTRELLRELAELHPEDPRAEMWTKV
ncbi:MAG TPA: DnaJ C-terminal domain-containing protein, partial [Bryobacteraceae bacterium]|nr:DnaJ C-terminal domain-containing protein [Bryobacteraceae bacterium]